MVSRLKSLPIIILVITEIMLLLSTSSCSKEESQTVEPSNPEILIVNTISDLDVSDLSNVSELTITKSIQGNDWNVLFEMSIYGKLKKLDISNATIIGDYNTQTSWKDNEIPEYNFRDSKTLEEVILPKSLKTIGQEAFANCKNLKKVQFSNSIDSIAARAFYKTSLEGEFNIPSTIKTIGKQAFAGTNISKVVINSDIHPTKESSIYTLYGNSVFANCQNLQEVIVAEGCTILELGFSNCENLNKVSLPSSLKKIGYESSKSGNRIFNKCPNLADIKLSDGILFIGQFAFSGTSIKNINIPNTVQYIGDFAFNDCEMLEEVSLSCNLIKVEHSCFNGCKSLYKIQIPERTEYIGSDAFKDCVSLKQITLGNNITSIKSNAFFNCSSLLSVKLPENLETLGESSFENCYALTDIILNDKLTILQDATFKNCTNLRNIILGKSIEAIGKNCFYNCRNLLNIEIPNSVKTFSDYSFAYSGLNEVKVHWTSPIQIDENIFTGLNMNKMVLIVPKGTSEAYANSKIWTKFGDIRENQ